MWPRLVIATLGGLIITLTMFYGMSEVAVLFNDRSPDLYYRVMNLIPGAPGPRRPQLRLPEQQPGLPQLEFAPGDTVVLDSQPQLTEDVEVAAPRPRLDANDRRAP